jgi:3'-5' exoribonuclease
VFVRGRPYRSVIVLLKDHNDGDDLDLVLVVREAEVRQKSDGGDFLKLTLGDRSCTVAAMVWDVTVPIQELCVVGAPVHVHGRLEEHPRWGRQIKVRALRSPHPDAYDPADLLDGPPRDVDQMEADLRELIATVRCAHLAALLAALLGPETATWAAFRDAPAAKHYHQAYRHGLLEHSLTVAQAVSSISATFPGIDRDLAVTGALLHDIGKLDAYATAVGGSIDLTDAGRLLGEIPLGYYRVRREVEALPDFPPALAQSLAHIVLSHHGSLAHGSPVVPATREATLVHMVDNLGGRLGSFDRLEKDLAPGAVWSGFDRAVGANAYFGDPGVTEPVAVPAPPPAAPAADPLAA